MSALPVAALLMLPLFFGRADALPGELPRRRRRRARGEGARI